MKHSINFEYESVSQAMGDLCGLLNVEAEVEIKRDRLNDSYEYGVVGFFILNKDNNKVVKFNDLPLNEQEEIKSNLDQVSFYEISNAIDNENEQSF